MTIKHAIALSTLAVSLILLQGCSTTPRTEGGAASVDSTQADNNEPDLVSQLRARMAAGTLQRQEKSEDKQPLNATADTSRSTAVFVDTAKQQAALAVNADYSKALSLMNAGKDDEALAQLARIAEKAPTLSGPPINQAVILNKQKKYADAKTILDKVLANDPENSFANNQLGITLRNLGKFADAKAAYQAALAKYPDYAKAHFNLGVLADLYLQDLPLAINHYQRYQSLQSTPDQAVNNWIIDLQKRTGTYVPPAKPAPLPPLPEETGEDATDESTTTEADNAPAQGEVQ